MDLFERFSKLTPLRALAPGDCRDLSKHAKVGRYARGQSIFERGEAASTVVFLIEGEVELMGPDGTRSVTANSPAALEPLSQYSPRKFGARALGECAVAFVDRERMDLLLTWAQSGAVEVEELGGGGDDDWMGALLSTPALSRLAPAQIGQLFAALAPVEYKAGDFIVREGDAADAYFVMCSGKCMVTRRNADGSHARVATLTAGDRFGEYALVADDTRSASVQATEAVSAMRMNAEDFRRLLGESMLGEVDPEDITEDAVLLDVRLPEEFRRGRLPDSINIPLEELRERMPELDAKKKHVVYCDSGRRSAGAVYLLTERGLKASLLRGGIAPDEMPVRG